MSPKQDTETILAGLEAERWDDPEGQAEAVVATRRGDWSVLFEVCITYAEQGTEGERAAAARLLRLAAFALGYETDEDHAPLLAAYQAITVTKEEALPVAKKEESLSATQKKQTEELADVLAEIIRRGLRERLADRSMTPDQAFDLTKRIDPRAFGGVSQH